MLGIAVALVVYVVLSFISPVHAATINAVSCSRTDVQNAVNTAAAGDTVQLPTCNQTTWDGTVTINKRIILTGNGASNTIIQRSRVPADFNTNVMFRVSNVIGFEMKDITLDGTRDTDENVWRDFALVLENCVDFRIHHMTFSDLAKGIWVFGDPTVIRGVIDHNLFIDIYYSTGSGSLGYGVSVNGNGTYPALSLGTAQNTFIEENTFTRNRHAVASNNGARYVFRYNTVTDNRPDAAIVDAHGKTDSWARGTRQYEVYNNTLIDLDSNHFAGVGPRGGDGVIFNNTISPMSSNRDIHLMNDSGCSGTYPLQDQIRELYIWNNIRSTGGPANITTACPSFIQLNRDYFTIARSGYTAYTYPHPLVSAEPPGPDIVSNLVLRLPFEEGSGNTANDTSGNNRHAALNGSFSWQSGQIGNGAIQFNGNGAHGAISGLLGTPSAITLAGHAQILVNNTNGGTILNAGDRVGFRVYSDRIRGFYHSGSGFVGLDYFTTFGSGFRHVTYVHTGSAHSLYLDGNFVATAGATPISWTGGGSNTTIGKHATTATQFDLNGRLDEVRVYARALTATDISALPGAGTTGLSLSIVNPTSNSTFATAINTVSLSGSALDTNGTIQNVTWTCPNCSTPKLGVADGTTAWSINNVTLNIGSNVFTVTVTDNENNQLVRTLDVIYTPPSNANFFVSTSGNDNNNGTSAGTAWRTIQKAMNTAGPGTVVSVGAGTYVERLVVGVSGTGSTQRITFQGAKAADGSLLTTIDGSVATSGWITAPEIGSGVYKANLGSPQGLTANGKAVWKINDPGMNGTVGFNMAGNGNFYLTRPSNATVTVLGSSILFWDSIEAFFGNKSNGTTYVRFRNNNDPNTMNVRVSPLGGTVKVASRNHVVIKDFRIVGGDIGVEVTGTSTGVIIEGNVITHGRNRIAVHQGGPNGTVIRNNVMYPDTLGFVSWTPGDREVLSAGGYGRVLNRHHYDVNKFVVGTTETVDSSILVAGTASNTEIVGNDISRGLMGLVTYQTPSNTTFHGNTCYFLSDICVYMNADLVTNLRVHSNLMYDVEHGLRLESSNRSHSIYIYANRFHGPHYAALGGGGQKHIFTGPPGGNQISPMTTWVYHNSFAGGGWAMDMGATAEVSYSHPNLHFRNNFYSINGISSGGTGPIGDLASNFNGGSLWRNNTVPSFWLPSGHAALNTAPSMAGFSVPFPSGDYFKDGLPDYGARQGPETSDPPPPDPPDPTPVPTALALLTTAFDSNVCGEGIMNDMRVQVLDQNRQPLSVTGLTVNVALGENPEDAELVGTLSVLTSAGVALFNNVCVDEGGDFTVVYSSPGLASVESNPFTVWAPPVSIGLEFVEQPTDTRAHSNIAPAVTVRLVDVDGNLIPDNDVAVTVSIEGAFEGVLLSGTLTRNTVSGVAVFDDLKINKPNLAYRLKAESLGLDSTVSGFFNITQRLGVLPRDKKSTGLLGGSRRY